MKHAPIETTLTLWSTNTWSTVTNDVPGTGWLLTLPTTRTNAQQYFRLKIRLSE